MDKAGVEAARIALQRADSSLDAMKGAQSFEVPGERMGRFSGGCTSRLQQASASRQD